MNKVKLKVKLLPFAIALLLPALIILLVVIMILRDILANSFLWSNVPIMIFVLFFPTYIITAILSEKTLEISDYGIIKKGFFGKKQMSWAEVKEVNISKMLGNTWIINFVSHKISIKVNALFFDNGSEVLEAIKLKIPNASIKTSSK